MSETEASVLLSAGAEQCAVAPGRLAVAGFPEGGVVVDLESGHFFRANGSAFGTCEAIAREGSGEGARRSLAAARGVTIELATKWIDDVTRLVTSLRPPDRDAGPPGVPSDLGVFRVRLEEGMLRLLHDDHPVLVVEPGTTRVLRAEAAPRFSLAFYLRVLAPRLLALRGHLVLHAAACRVGTELAVFSGHSGAGKTTTMKALAKAGAAPVCEDLLVVRLVQESPFAVLGSEDAIWSWAAEGGAALARGQAAWSCTSLDEAVAGRTLLPLKSIDFIDSRLARGATFHAAPLDRSEILERLLWARFLGSSAPEAWASLLASCRAVAAGLKARDVRMPDGLAALDAWGRDYIENCTS